MKDGKIEGVFLLFVRIYKQLDAMVQNGILLTFTRLATICLCFFGREFPVPFSFPPSRKLHLQVSFQRPPQTKAGQENNLSPFLAMLQYQTWAHYLWVSIYILLSTLCTLRFKASAFFCLSTALLGFLIPNTSLFSTVSVCSSVHLHLFMCVWRVLWNSLDKEELSKRWTFLSTE